MIPFVLSDKFSEVRIIDLIVVGGVNEPKLIGVDQSALGVLTVATVELSLPSTKVTLKSLIPAIIPPPWKLVIGVALTSQAGLKVMVVGLVPQAKA